MSRALFITLAAAALAVAVAAVAAQLLAGRAAATLVREGNTAMARESPAEAALRYQKARAEDPASVVPLYNLGLAFYGQKNLPEALSDLQSIDRPPKDLSASVHYNQGNVLARMGKAAESVKPEAAVQYYQMSIAAYKRALQIEPKRIEAARNVEVVRRWMQDLIDRLPPPSAQNGAKGAPHDGQQNQRDQAPPGNQDNQQNSPADTSGQMAQTPQTPLDNTARAILNEERDRRSAEAQAKSEVQSDEISW